MRQSPAQAVVASLRRNGVDTIFGLDGDHVISLYDALSDAPDINVVTIMHENNASIAAELYARVTGRPGVVLVTAGPGATNSLSGIAGAYAAGVPIVHISGGVPAGSPQEAFHGVDDVEVLQKVFAPVTKQSRRIENAADIPTAIDDAFALASQGRPGPVHVEIALSALTSGDLDLPDAPLQTGAPTATPDITAIAARIDAAAQVALVAGKNAFWSDVSAALVSLAEHLQAPVAHVWDSHGAMPTVHPLSLGLWRAGDTSEFVDATFDSADLVLGIGVRRGNASGVTLRERLGDRFVMIDAVDDPADNEHLDTASVAALAETLQAIAAATRERAADPATIEHCATAQRLFKAGMAVEIERYRDEPAWPISVALDSLARKMTPETIVVSDVSNVKIWAPVQLPAYNSLSHLQSGSWGAMGYVVPGVLGAAIARPDRKIVGIVGDAAFLMGSNDFATICALKLPVVIAVHADQTIGMIFYSLKHAFNRTYKTEVPPVDFVAYAEALGGKGIRVDTPDQIDAAWDEALSATGPVLLEIRAGHDFPRPSPIQRIIEQGRNA